MSEKCAQSISVTRMLGHSVFDDAVGCVAAAASDDTQEIASLGGCLMWENTNISGERVRLNIFVRILSDKWK